MYPGAPGALKTIVFFLFLFLDGFSNNLDFLGSSGYRGHNGKNQNRAGTGTRKNNNQTRTEPGRNLKGGCPGTPQDSKIESGIKT